MLRLNEKFQVSGMIRPRNIAETNGSKWILGCETLDRDFADYEQYKEYLAPLGIGKIRLQAGWAKTEKAKGVFDFSWLDRIVDDARGRGLGVILETDYGNSIYEGGGGWDLTAQFPTSGEGLAAWDRWVEALARHFRGRVIDWAMWNEPDNGGLNSIEDIAYFNIRTAEIIRRIIPDARIGALSLAMCRAEPLWKCLMIFRKEGKLSLFHRYIYHCYDMLPEECYSEVEKMKNILRTFTAAAELRQGESGCPSERTTHFALAGHDWTEFSQAKWDLRRMLGDLGHDVESSVFTICDFNHKGRQINRKGLLLADENHTVLRPKKAYYAVQNATAVFDGSFTHAENNCISLIAHGKASLFTFRDKQGRLLAAYWDHADVPGDSHDTGNCQITLMDGSIRDPVLCDLLSGRVYDIPSGVITGAGEFRIFRDMPYADSPLLLTDRTALPLRD